MRRDRQPLHHKRAFAALVLNLHSPEECIGVESRVASETSRHFPVYLRRRPAQFGNAAGDPDNKGYNTGSDMQEQVVIGVQYNKLKHSSRDSAAWHRLGWRGWPGFKRPGLGRPGWKSSWNAPRHANRDTPTSNSSM
jgi:hypothetical protein